MTAVAQTIGVRTRALDQAYDPISARAPSGPASFFRERYTPSDVTSWSVTYVLHDGALGNDDVQAAVDAILSAYPTAGVGATLGGDNRILATHLTVAADSEEEATDLAASMLGVATELLRERHAGYVPQIQREGPIPSAAADQTV